MGEKRTNVMTIIRKENQVSRMNDMLQTLGTLSTRMKYAETLGQTYGGNRDLYQALGYKRELTYQDYYQKYKRADISKIIISKPADALWGNPPVISEEDRSVVDIDENSLKNQWLSLVKRLNLYSQLMRLDKLLGLGRFAILLFGFDDSVDFSTILSEEADLLYVQPYGEDNIKILTYETDHTNPRYGHPIIYQLSIQNPGTTTAVSTIRVHYSRVLHVVEDTLESPIFGTPRLEAVFNRLEDLQKLLGGSAEMFWRGARPGYVAKAETDATFGTIDAKAMQDQFDEFEHNLRRWLTPQGVDIKALDQQIASPKEHIDVQIMMISIVTGIPKRILTGSERGELASTQDEKMWNALIKNRMLIFAEIQILRPLIDKLIDSGVLKTDKDDYLVTWPKMSAMGEKEKADVTKTRSQAIAEYLKTPGADMLVPPEIWLRDEFGYNEDQIKQIQVIVGDVRNIEELDENVFADIVPTGELENEGNEDPIVDNITKEVSTIVRRKK